MVNLSSSCDGLYTTEHGSGLRWYSCYIGRSLLLQGFLSKIKSSIIFIARASAVKKAVSVNGAFLLPSKGRVAIKS